MTRTITPASNGTVTPAEEWRRPRTQGYLVQFPSGLRARIRPVGLMTFVRLGKMPDLLSAFVDESIKDGTYKLKEVDSLDTLQAHAKLLDAICETCFVEPSIEGGDIGLEDVVDSDKTALLNWFILPAAMLRSFRPEQTIDLFNLQYVKDDAPSAEQADAGSGVRAPRAEDARPLDATSV